MALNSAMLGDASDDGVEQVVIGEGRDTQEGVV